MMKNEMSQSIAKLALALSKAQAEIKGAVKDSTNPFFKSSYADLQSVIDACRPALTKNELAVVQATGYDDAGNVYVATTLAHSSGEFMTGYLPIKAKAQDPQGQGSAITYARRYALASMVGVYQEDDDGEKSMEHGKKLTPATPAKKPEQPAETLDMSPPKGAPTKEQLYAVAKEKLGTKAISYVIEKLIEKYKVKQWAELSDAQKVEFYNWIEKHDTL